MARHDKTFYRLNRSHPLVLQALATAGSRAALSALLRLIEETVPFPHIRSDGPSRQDVLPAEPQPPAGAAGTGDRRQPRRPERAASTDRGDGPVPAHQI